MNKSAWLCILLVFAVVLSAQAPPPGGMGHRGFGPGFGIMSAGPGSRTPVTGAPYSAVETVQFQQSLSGGNEISRQQQSKVFRDSQGRVRIEHAANGWPGSTSQTPRTVVTIFDPVAGMSHTLNPGKMTAVETQLRPAHSGDASQEPHVRGGRANAAQVQTENLGTQMINGVAATGTRVTETIAAGAMGNSQAIHIVRTTWVSTELKIPVQITSSDPRFGETVMNLTNIVRSEPDVSLFQVPAGYTTTTRAGGAGRAGMRRRSPTE